MLHEDKLQLQKSESVEKFHSNIFFLIQFLFFSYRLENFLSNVILRSTSNII